MPCKYVSFVLSITVLIFVYIDIQLFPNLYLQVQESQKEFTNKIYQATMDFSNI